jgi:hypothetical protein
MGSLFQANFVQSNFTQGGSSGPSCFDPADFDKLDFDTSCVPSSGGGKLRRVYMPIFDNRQHDDELALVLLEAA